MDGLFNGRNKQILEGIDPSARTLYLIGKDFEGFYQLRKLKRRTQIVAGLAKGDTVIVHSVRPLAEDLRVKAVPSLQADR